MISAPLPLLALIAGIVALAFRLQDRFHWARKVSATLIVVILSALVSNLGLVAEHSPVYDTLDGPVTSLAIVWLLLAVHLSGLKKAGTRMLAHFGIAVTATIAGAFVAVLLFGHLIGDEASKLGGVMIGTYSGGSLNFVAVKRAVGLSDDLTVAATAADNLITALWFAATLVLPTWLKRRGSQAAPETAEPQLPESEEDSSPSLRIPDLAILLVLGLGVMLLAEAIARIVPGIPGILWLTTLSLILAQLPAIQRIRGSMAIGILALHFFFAVIGIRSRIDRILEQGLGILWFTLTVVLVHGLIVYGIAVIRRSDLETTSVASQAAIGGPSTALALAAARSQPQLELPGLAVGLLGYAVGTYAGVAFARVFALWLA